MFAVMNLRTKCKPMELGPVMRELIGEHVLRPPIQVSYPEMEYTSGDQYIFLITNFDWYKGNIFIVSGSRSYAEMQYDVATANDKILDKRGEYYIFALCKCKNYAAVLTRARAELANFCTERAADGSHIVRGLTDEDLWRIICRIIANEAWDSKKNIRDTAGLRRNQ